MAVLPPPPSRARSAVGPRDLHRFADVARLYLRGSTAWKRDVLQSSFGTTRGVDPAILRRTASLAELRAEGAAGGVAHAAYALAAPRPRVCPPSARWAVSTRHEATARAVEVAELREALVAGGAVRTEDGRWLRDLHPTTRRAFLKVLPKVEAAAQRTDRRLGGTSALLMLRNVGNYYHWLHQILPQVDAILGARPGRAIDRWLVRELPPFGAEMLARIGVDLARVEILGDAPVVCERIVVATVPSMGAIADPDGWPLRLLRDLFLPSDFSPPNAAPPWRRVYLRRGDGDQRPIVNRREVDAFLVDQGFEIREMNRMGVAEQARLMAESSLIVAPHGAALANLVFCAPGARVVELLPRLWPSPLFAMIARACGLSHVFVPGVEPCLPGLKVRHIGAATKVPIPRLAQALRAGEDL